MSKTSEFRQALIAGLWPADEPIVGDLDIFAEVWKLFRLVRDTVRIIEPEKFERVLKSQMIAITDLGDEVLFGFQDNEGKFSVIISNEVIDADWSEDLLYEVKMRKDYMSLCGELSRLQDERVKLDARIADLLKKQVQFDTILSAHQS